jgi:hypothetical protein
MLHAGLMCIAPQQQICRSAASLHFFCGLLLPDSDAVRKGWRDVQDAWVLSELGAGQRARDVLLECFA